MSSLWRTKAQPIQAGQPTALPDDQTTAAASARAIAASRLRSGRASTVLAGQGPLGGSEVAPVEQQQLTPGPSPPPAGPKKRGKFSNPFTAAPLGSVLNSFAGKSNKGGKGGFGGGIPGMGGSGGGIPGIGKGGPKIPGLGG